MRTSSRRTAKGVTKKIASRGAKKKAAPKRGLKMVFCAPESFKMTGLPRGEVVTLDWGETEQQWKATVGGIVHRLPTFFLSPRSAKEDPKRFAAEALGHLERVMAAGPRTVGEQKGPLALRPTSQSDRVSTPPRLERDQVDAQQETSV